MCLVFLVTFVCVYRYFVLEKNGHYVIYTYVCIVLCTWWLVVTLVYIYIYVYAFFLGWIKPLPETIPTCTVTNVGPNVDASGCQGRLPDEACYPTCNSGYVPQEGGQFYCAAKPLTIDLAPFVCAPRIPGIWENIRRKTYTYLERMTSICTNCFVTFSRSSLCIYLVVLLLILKHFPRRLFVATCRITGVSPTVDASSCSTLKESQSCTLTCTTPQMARGVGNSRPTCPINGGVIDMSSFSCRSCMWRVWIGCMCKARRVSLVRGGEGGMYIWIMGW